MEKALSHKVKIIELLVTELGVNTEKELAELSMEKLLEIDNVTISQLREIQKLKKSVKDNKLFSYLSESLEKRSSKADDNLNDDV